MDFPDQFIFSDSPVQFESKKSILVRNVGDSSSKFEIESTAPFVIEPSSGFLEVGQTMQFSIAFLPKVI